VHNGQRFAAALGLTDKIVRLLGQLTPLVLLAANQRQVGPSRVGRNHCMCSDDLDLICSTQHDLTAAVQVRSKVLQHLQDIAQLMSSWRADKCSTLASGSSSARPTLAAAAGSSSSQQQQQQQAAMDAAVSDLLHLRKAMYIVTPHIVYALKDVNLLTGQPEVPPDSEFLPGQSAAAAAAAQACLLKRALVHIGPCKNVIGVRAERTCWRRRKQPIADQLPLLS
jgi:hypothetical protein